MYVENIRSCFHSHTYKLLTNNKEEKKMGNYNVELYYDKESKSRVFYVRPFSKELKDDLDRLIVDAHKVAETVSIYEKDGTYAIKTTSEGGFMEGFWGILFRRFMSESKRVCIDPITEEKYYVLIFSPEFIKPCARKLAA